MNRAIVWFRALSVVLGIFTLGHTAGTRHSITHGLAEDTVIAAMQRVHVPVMGFNRSYWEFYRGFSVTISILLAALAVFAWQLGNLSRRDSEATRPLAVTMLVSCIAIAIASFVYFFTAPMFLSTLAVIFSANALRLVSRDAASRGASA
jgi:D-alanyl-lipoteichoic acid acyltransferase DltB (MBOAT superfamily)